MAALRRSLLRLQQTLNFSVRSAEASISTLGRVYVSLRRVGFSIESGQTDHDIFFEEQRRPLHNRLLYRSKQRGFLELDLVLGKWVEENIKSMDDLQIKALVDVLDLIQAAQPFPFQTHVSVAPCKKIQICESG